MSKCWFMDMFHQYKIVKTNNCNLKFLKIVESKKKVVKNGCPTTIFEKIEGNYIRQFQFSKASYALTFNRIEAIEDFNEKM